MKLTNYLSERLRTVIAFTAAVDWAIGLLFLFNPELQIGLWPTPVSPVLARFIGAIIIGNGAGAMMIARQGTWEGARALIAVALVYGAIVLAALLYHLLAAGAPTVFWVYAVVDGVFLLPIAYVYFNHERLPVGSG